MSDFLLNCFVLGDDEERVFPVKILRNDNVGILKDEIKKKILTLSLVSMLKISDLEALLDCFDGGAVLDGRKRFTSVVVERRSSLVFGHLRDA